MNFLIIIIMITLFSFACANESKDSAYQWLEKMTTASHEQNYQGTFVYFHDGQLQTMQVWHRGRKEGEHQRLWALSGETREVIHDGAFIACLWPGMNSMLQPEYSNTVNKNLYKKISNSYDVILDGQDRVAGYIVQIVWIKPKDNYRYGYKLFLEKETGLLLKSELLDIKHNIIEQMMFTEFEILQNIQKINDNMQKFPNSKVKTVDTDKSWQFDLGYNFDLQAYTTRILPMTQQHPITHLIYSDGLAAISLFIETKTEQFELDNFSGIGAMNTYVSTLKDYKITLIGEVPAITLKRIMHTVKLQINSQL